MMYRRPAGDVHRDRSQRGRARPVRRPPEPEPVRKGSRLSLFASIAVMIAALVAIVVLHKDHPATGIGPAHYEVVYLVDDTSSGSGQRRWEVLDVRDPVDVSDLTYASDPRTGAAPQGGTVTDSDGLYNLSAGGLTLVSHREPALGSGALSLGVELTQLFQWGLAQDLHQARTIAGQRCQMVRLSEPPAGPLTAVSGGDHDDVCLTTTGIELSESWTYLGRVVLSRLAQSVSLATPLPGIEAAPDPGTPSSSASDVIQVTSPAAPSFIAVPTAPTGFSKVASLSITADDPQQKGTLLYRASDWSFENGGQLITVEAGAGGTPWDDSGVVTRSQNLPGLGPATVVLRSDGPQLQLSLANQHWLVIGGTVPISQLISYASTLEAAAAG
ncbi:MAG TPA: hypothetical protein VG435_08985 [Acidimicrobiales bacterium]|jgi:hypothetical protein|nr:hypothetical protein [Acidimicrobiales bacterium]